MYTTLHSLPLPLSLSTFLLIHNIVRITPHTPSSNLVDQRRAPHIHPSIRRASHSLKLGIMTLIKSCVVYTVNHGGGATCLIAGHLSAALWTATRQPGTVTAASQPVTQRPATRLFGPIRQRRATCHFPPPPPAHHCISPRRHANVVLMTAHSPAAPRVSAEL